MTLVIDGSKDCLLFFLSVCLARSILGLNPLGMKLSRDNLSICVTCLMLKFSTTLSSPVLNNDGS